MHIWKLFQVQPVLSNDEGGGGGGGGDIGGQGGNQHLQEDLDLLNSDDRGDGDQGDDDGTGDQGDDSDPDERRNRPPRNRDRSAERGEGDDADDDADDQDDDDADDQDDDDQQDDDDEQEEDEEGDDKDKDDEGKKVRVQGRPTIAQIRAYDKKLFQYLPGLRDVIFSEQKFREHIADPEQAQEFAEKAIQFDSLESDLSAGSPRLLLSQLREGNPEAFTQVATNFMREVRTLDSQLYSRLTLPIIKEALFHASNYAKQRGGREGDNLQRAAEWMSDFVFQNGGKIEPLEEERGGKHPAEIQLEKERQQRETEQYKQVSGDINGRIDRALVGLITEGMDPRLNKFMKGVIIDRVLEDIVGGIGQDKPFTMKLRGIWSRAKLAQYPEQMRKQIVDAHVNRARGLFRELRDKYTREALGGQRPQGQRNNGEEDRNRDRNRNQDRQNNERDGKPRKRRFDSQGGRGDGRSQGSRREAVLDSSKIDYSRTTDADILSGDRGRIKLRGGSR